MAEMIEFLITSSILILFVMGIRRCFWGRVKHKFIYGLWMVVLVRFLCPFNFVDSSLSVMNGIHQIQMLSGQQRKDGFKENVTNKESKAGEQFADSAKADGKNENMKAVQENTTAKQEETVSSVAMEETQTEESVCLVWALRIWILGILVCLSIFLYSNLRFYKRLRRNRKPIPKYQRGRLTVYETDQVFTPCLFGICKPAVYIPEHIMMKLCETDIQQVLEHEQMHYNHLDHIWSFVRCMIVSFYWFDPLIWLAAKISKQDAEFACDEGVLEKKSYSERIVYGEMLLHVAMHSKSVSILCPVTAVHNGKKEMKKRMEEIGMKKTYQKSILILLSMVITFGMAITFTGCGAKEKTEESIIGSAIQENEEEKITEKTNQVPISEPVLDMSEPTGVDGVQLYYADDEKLIFAGYFGLFIYSRAEEKVTHSVDLKPIGCNMTQGDEACDISISEDGEMVYLHSLGQDEMYIYNIEENNLSKERYSLENITLYQYGRNFDKGTVTYISKGEEKEIALTNRYQFIGDLGYSENSGPAIPIFIKSPYKDTIVFKPEDIHDLIEAVVYIGGKEYKITNTEDLKWLEKRFANPVEEIKGGSSCPFYNPMYLLRKDKVAGMIYPALDSCSIYRTAEDKYYKYDKESNEEFLKILGWSY